MLRRLAITLSLCLVAMQANAERILLVIEGGLSAIGSDTYGLDGASFRGSYVYDVDSGPPIFRWWDQDQSEGNCLDTGINVWRCTWPMAYAHVEFSGRPAGLADVSTDLSRLVLRTEHYGGVTQDRYQWFDGVLPAALFGDYSGDVNVLNGLWIDDGLDGAVTPWDYADFTDLFPVVRAGEVLTGPGARYAIVNPTLAEVSIIPIPAAVWLFGSALGVMGWMRRPQLPA